MSDNEQDDNNLSDEEKDHEEENDVTYLIIYLKINRKFLCFSSNIVLFTFYCNPKFYFNFENYFEFSIQI